VPALSQQLAQVQPPAIFFAVQDL